MKTEISTFCAACSSALATLPSVLEAAGEEMARLEGTASARALPVVNDLRARLRSLTDKLESQQSFLLIFGPLKSGKSTLVNALSGTYVSEVTSLPGYPCLVYVQHADSPKFGLTRYNGRESHFGNANVLRDVIADSHVALADQIRDAENCGHSFDPAADFPEAIRRVDVKVPIPNLIQSGTALVDTPGLYSRMNFGYDMLTREFRNSAACAVFVVKTDNLFLEQVFTEFDQLLKLFSRIFLVINVDSNKRDLQPDGTLTPSAESSDPEKVVQAFTTLSMTGPLRQAYEENRLRIHALDLMNAASVCLQKGRNVPANAATRDARADARSRFDAFVSDLTEYLNGNEYAREFMRDSVRQARQLCQELRELAGAGEIRQLRDRQDALALEMRILDHRIASVARLGRTDWRSGFDDFRAEAERVAQDRVVAATARVIEESREALDRWYQSGDSLKQLEEEYWDPLLVHAGLQLTEENRAHLVSAVGGSFGGAQLPHEAVEDLHRIGINLGALSDAALSAREPSDSLEPYLLTLMIDDIPIGKTLADWFFFRRSAGLRRRVFGEDLRFPLDAATKQARLGSTTREALLRIVEQSIQLKFGSLPTSTAVQAAGAYVDRFCASLDQALHQKREQFTQAREGLEKEFEANSQIVSLVRSLEKQAVATDTTLAGLQKQERSTPARQKERAFVHSEAGVEFAA